MAYGTVHRRFTADEPVPMTRIYHYIPWRGGAGRSGHILRQFSHVPCIVGYVFYGARGTSCNSKNRARCARAACQMIIEGCGIAPLVAYANEGGTPSIVCVKVHKWSVDDAPRWIFSTPRYLTVTGGKKIPLAPFLISTFSHFDHGSPHPPHGV